MAVQFVSSEVIDRPIEKVFHFFAVEHVRNHPRWDSDISLWLDSDTPIGIGTVIHRLNKRSGVPVKGTMKVVEFETNRVIGMEIHDGPDVMFGRTTFEAIDENKTKIIITIDIPWMDESADRSFLNNRLSQVSKIRKQLMESEL